MSNGLLDNPNLIPGLPPTDYYAPNFKVLVEGRELDETTHGDILDLKVTMEKDHLTSFELTVNNWDDKSFDFKYSDTTTFDIGNRVDIQMGYADRLRYMARGVVTTLTPRFPESGVPTLGVTGVDSLVKLKEKKPKDGQQKIFKNMEDWKIAGEVARRNKLEFEPTKEGKPQELVNQGDQTEAIFLLERAKRNDFDCFIRVNPETGHDRLFFMKPTNIRDARRSRIYVFEWGRNLMNFNPQLTLNRQVASVEVRGWDPRTKEPITYKAQLSDLPDNGGGGTNGAKAADKKLDKPEHIVVNKKVLNVQEARDLAISMLRERAYKFLTGSGQVIGLPDLRPGDNLELKGLGQRFSGPADNPIQYEITKVVHSLGNSGYLTQFSVRSATDGGTSKGQSQ
ncbi:MAG: type IV secretion protein Rhs [Blastocatellia bacterium]